MEPPCGRANTCDSPASYHRDRDGWSFVMPVTGQLLPPILHGQPMATTLIDSRVPASDQLCYDTAVI